MLLNWIKICGILLIPFTFKGVQLRWTKRSALTNGHPARSKNSDSFCSAALFNQSIMMIAKLLGVAEEETRVHYKLQDKQAIEDINRMRFITRHLFDGRLMV